jgi:hypothetical protein
MLSSKTLAALFFSLPLLAQIPTSGPVGKYDAVPVTGGTTLVDLCGHGNNGTLHGTTPGTRD